MSKTEQKNLMRLGASLALSLLFVLPLSTKASTKIYLRGFGTLTSAQNLGYNEDAPGVEGDITLLTNRVSFNLNGYYSTAKKVKTNKGFSAGANFRLMYRIAGKLFISSGLKWKYYTARLWEKKAILWAIGVKYGHLEDLIQVGIYHAFKENQTTSECVITTVELTSTILKGKSVGIQIKSSTQIVRYNYGQLRKTGLSADVGIGVYFKL